MMTISNRLLGADPELFLEKDGKIISAEGLIGGTKEKPKIISDKGHAIQEDNIMIEFNIPACSNKFDFKKEIKHVLDYLDTMVNMNGCKLNYSSSSFIDKKYLKTEQAKMFGCDPDLNFYLKDLNDSPNANTNLRTCGGHIHIGYDNPNVTTSEWIVFAMDYVLGLESLFLDDDDQRRTMYGKAGSFRFKNYGVEYRTLSNFWIRTPELIEWAFTKTDEALDLVRSGEIKDIYNSIHNKVEKAINNNDKKLAKKLLKNKSIKV